MKIVKIIIRSALACIFAPILCLAMAFVAFIGCGLTTWDFISGELNISQWVKQK
jgi:hypothetical protein